MTCRGAFGNVLLVYEWSNRQWSLVIPLNIASAWPCWIAVPQTPWAEAALSDKKQTRFFSPLTQSLATPLLTEEPLTYYSSSHSRPLPKVRLHYTLERELGRKRRKKKKLQTSYAVACCLFCRSEAIMGVIKWKTITQADKTFFGAMRYTLLAFFKAEVPCYGMAVQRKKVQGHVH